MAVESLLRFIFFLYKKKCEQRLSFLNKRKMPAGIIAPRSFASYPHRKILVLNTHTHIKIIRHWFLKKKHEFLCAMCNSSWPHWINIRADWNINSQHTSGGGGDYDRNNRIKKNGGSWRKIRERGRNFFIFWFPACGFSARLWFFLFHVTYKDQEMRNRCRRINNLEFYFGTEDVKKKMQMSYRVCVCVDRGGGCWVSM